MSYSNSNQLSLNLVCESTPNVKRPNPFILSERVKRILFKRGYSYTFNYPDYQQFKKACQATFNKAEAIADLFIENTSQEGDLEEYNSPA